MKKILFFIPTLTGRGAEKVLVNLVNNIDKTKFDVTVMTLFNVGVNIKNLDESIEYKYVFNKLFRGNKHLFKVFKPKQLFNFMIKDTYDVIISYLEGPTTRIVSGCNNKNTKIVNWVHNEFHNTYRLKSSYRNEKEMKKCYEKYDSTIFVAESAKKAFEKTMPSVMSNLKVLYNTVDTDLIKSKSLEKINDLSYEGDKINLISVGKFTHQKGYERLLKVISKLVNEDNMNIHLYLLGNGDQENKYKEIILENNIKDNVTLLGFKSNPYKYVKNADLFVCSSYYEGYSTAVTESIIVGTPVITTLCSGMEEMLGRNGEYGMIVENSDIELYNGLKLLLNNPELIHELKVKADSRSEFFNMINTVKSVEDFIESL